MNILVNLVQFYQRWISPLLPSACRFAPTCSEYARQSLVKYPVKGVFLSLKRLLRCHPFCEGGIDPVP